MSRILGLILAGGLSRRMQGNDKALLNLDGKKILTHVTERVHPQVDSLVLNVNRNFSFYKNQGLPLISDEFAGFPGPLAGIHAGMLYGKKQGFNWLASFACDVPFVPFDFVSSCRDRLAAESDKGKTRQSKLVVASSKGRIHPVLGLWSMSLLDHLTFFLETGERKVGLFVSREACLVNEFMPLEGLDPFLNINTLADLTHAQSQSLSSLQHQSVLDPDC